MIAFRLRFHYGFLSGLLPAENVHHGEDHNPDSIHKMPIERQYLKTLRVSFAQLAEQAERQRESEHEQVPR